MIDVKRAVELAKALATDILGPTKFRLEEVERDSYKDREVWSITLSYPPEPDQITPFQRLGNLGTLPLKYKRMLIDTETGELVAMKIRELAAL
jgi:hypothetical protein